MDGATVQDVTDQQDFKQDSQQDNIEDRNPLPIVTPQQPQFTTLPQPKNTPPTEMFNIHQACDAIAKHYNRSYELQFFPPAQIVDGGIMDIKDAETGAVLATCRMRFRNALAVNNLTSEILCGVSLSDLTFQRGHFNCSVKIKTQQ
jgi:hypothetical protein